MSRLSVYMGTYMGIIILIKVLKLHFDNNRVIKLDISRFIWINRLHYAHARLPRQLYRVERIVVRNCIECNEVEKC